MKTSNKLLLVAVLTVLGYCIASAFAVKKEYLKGDYKKRFYNMKQINVSNFDTICADVPKSSIIIEYGKEYAVWINNDRDDLDFKQKNKTLYVDVDPLARSSYGSDIIIICPEIKALKLGNEVPPERKLAILKEPENNPINGSYNTIKGFKQANMTAEVNNATFITLIENKIGRFNGTANWGGLIVTRLNTIDTARLNIDNHSELNLDIANIKTPVYKLAKQAKIQVTGEALPLLNK